MSQSWYSMDSIDTNVRINAMQGEILSREEELRLARAWRDERDYAARDKLVTAHQKLVVSMTKRYCKHGLPFRDLLNQGILGLLQAADRFDPESGFRFSTYAQWWARTCMQEFAQHSASVVCIGRSRRERVIMRSIMAGRSTTEELLEIPGATDLEIERMKGALQHTSVNAENSESGDEYLAAMKDETISESGFLSVPLAKVQRKVMAEVLAELNEREMTVLRERFLSENPRTLRAISEQLQVSAERVRQIERSALKRLRNALKTRGYRADDLLPCAA